jgi:Family of unknown function (DUF5715)
MLKSTLALCLLAFSLAAPASARVHQGRPRMVKIFAANHDSIRLENEVANAMGAYRYFTQAQVNIDVSNRHLSAFYDCTVYVISPKLPIERRYALPATIDFVYDLSRKYYGSFKQPLMVDSAVRPATIQRDLHLRSAAPAYGERASTHERGTTVDISKRMTRAQHDWMVMRLLYYRAIGRVLVIEERGCFHIFVRSEL